MRLLAIWACLCCVLIACTRDETLTQYATPGSYTLTEINNAPATFPATLVLSENGRISGNGPCNSYSTQITVPYPWFELGPIVATERACAQLAGEATFFATLKSATLSEASGEILILSDEAGPVLIFQAE